MPIRIVGLPILVAFCVALFPAVAAAQSGTAVVRVVSQSPGGGSFQFTGTPSGSVAAGASLSAPSLAPGSYTTTQSAAAEQLVGIACDDMGSGTPSVGDVATRSATFHIDAGETVTCTFTYAGPDAEDRSGSPESSPENAASPADGTNPFSDPDEDFADFPIPDDLPDDAGTYRAPKAGPWTASNHLGSMACTGFSAPLKPSTESGTLDVSDDGLTVVGTGFSAGTAPVTMQAVPAINGRYWGTVGGSQDGIPMTIEFVWQLVTDEYIVGYLTSTVSQSGMTCRMFRTYDLRYTGS